MSTPLPLSATLFVGGVHAISAAGTVIIDGLGPAGNVLNYILTDMSLTLIEAVIPAAGMAQINFQIGIVNFSTGLFFPFHSVAWVSLPATAAVNLPVNLLTTRSFPSACILTQKGNLAIKCTTFTNLSAFVIALDLSGFSYNN